MVKDINQLSIYYFFPRVLPISDLPAARDSFFFAKDSTAASSFFFFASSRCFRIIANLAKSARA